ncbi:MAG TPA: glycosyltransferase family 4 protein [Acidimicrobiales bacterium]|nr:glycosyltransferase family 4 protein [Acidimicrobiales bacterium]
MRPLLLANRGFQLGGGEVGLVMLVEGLLERGLDPVVVLPTPGPLLDGLPVDRRVCGRNDLRAVLRDAAPSCSVVHTYSAGGFRAAHGADLGLPVILHALVPNPTVHDPHLARLADLVVANSQATARRFRPASNIRVVYNGVAPSSMPRGGSVLTRTGRRTIALLGGIGPRKGQLDALPALADLTARRRDVDVVFVGRANGWHAQLLRRHTSGHPQMRMVGFVPDAGAHLGAFDLVLVPSRSEGFGRVAVEALRAGTPVLATPVEGLREALADLPDPWLGPDPRTWLARIERELDDPHVDVAALRRAGQRFDPARFVDDIVSIYRELAPTGSPR